MAPLAGAMPAIPYAIDADATMVVRHPYKKQLLHLIFCERYREL